MLSSTSTSLSVFELWKAQPTDWGCRTSRSHRMIEKVITIASLDEDTSRQDLAYWLSRPSEERLAAVELLRERVFDLPQRIERILEIAERGTNRP